jgi:hypothetical protein
VQQLLSQQKLQQAIRDARANADALEGYLANMNPAYRSTMPDVQERIRRLVEQSFHSRGMSTKDFVDRFPSSYGRLREVVKR